MSQVVNVGSVTLGNTQPLAFLLGPCAIESRDVVLRCAEHIAALRDKYALPVIFKSSYDKANRSSSTSFRGIGMEAGLRVLEEVKQAFGFPIVTDIHESDQAAPVAEVVDLLQIPAFLCRQTDLLVAAGQTGKPINIKKGQFMAPWDMGNSIGKITATGNAQVTLTERGVSFGYNNLVVDFRSLAIMAKTGCPVVFDATHAVQLPGGMGDRSGGQSEFVPLLARCAVAAGVAALFMEVHTDPSQALCDGPNMLSIKQLDDLLPQLLALDATIKGT